MKKKLGEINDLKVPRKVDFDRIFMEPKNVQNSSGNFILYRDRTSGVLITDGVAIRYGSNFL